MNPSTAPSHAAETADVTPDSVILSTLVGAALAAGGFAIGLGATGLAEGSTSFWYLSRASGFVAYMLLWGSVVWGLLLSTGTGRRWMRPPLLLDVHQFLGTAALGFTGFHGLILMGDRYVSFPLRAIVLPFAGTYEPLLVACGQIAVWLSLLLIVSFHVRHRIGGRMWRRLHYASFLAFWLALLHGLLLGSESATSWAAVIYLLTAGTVIFLFLYRVLSLPILHGVLAGGDPVRQT